MGYCPYPAAALIFEIFEIAFASLRAFVGASEAMRRHKLHDLRSPEEKRIWEIVRTDLARMRKERREAAKAAQMPLADNGGSTAWMPPPVLKRGMRADPLREHCRHNLSTLLTDREFREFKRQHRRIGRRLTVSTMLRLMICEYLEANRASDCPELPFGIDLKALCWRSRRCSRE